ncbi:MAG TPA: hypothetical protein VF450_11675 [Noviherbaspirillum sp.]
MSELRTGGLQHALKQLGYDPAQDPGQWRELVAAIHEFSKHAGDTKLERACIQEMASLDEKAQLEAFLIFCANVEVHLRGYYGLAPEEAKRTVDRESEWLAKIDVAERDTASVARTIIRPKSPFDTRVELSISVC